jgi:hypothetical protein
MNVDGFKAQADNAKQVIALCTGALAFTVTFIDKFRLGPCNAPLPSGLYVAWVLFGLAIGLALWYLMALTGNIGAVARKQNRWRMTDAQRLSAEGDESNATLPGLLMVASFFLSITSLIWLGFSLA